MLVDDELECIVLMNGVKGNCIINWWWYESKVKPQTLLNIFIANTLYNIAK